MEKNVTIAVCDDEELIVEIVSSKIYKIFTQCGIGVDCDRYKSSVELSKVLSEGKKYDVLFLDIDMPKLSGLDLAKNIRKSDVETDIIFVSNRDDRVFETFSVQPFGFIRKHNFNNDLKDALRAYINKRIVSNSYFVVKTHNATAVRRLRIADVVYIESFRNQQTIYMADGEEIKIRMTMQDLEDKLREYDILRIYKGYLVNLKYVQRIEKTGVIVNYKDGVTISVSRERLQELKIIYLDYLRKIGTVFFTQE